MSLPPGFDKRVRKRSDPAPSSGARARGSQLLTVIAVEFRMGAVARGNANRSVSIAGSSNRICGFPASGWVNSESTNAAAVRHCEEPLRRSHPPRRTRTVDGFPFASLWVATTAEAIHLFLGAALP
jgi:hypothetical protein